MKLDCSECLYGVYSAKEHVFVFSSNSGSFPESRLICEKRIFLFTYYVVKDHHAHTCQFCPEYSAVGKEEPIYARIPTENS